MKPLAHLKTNSARRMHHCTVISSDISWRNSAGMVSVVTSWRLAVFKILRKPNMTGWREFISLGLLIGSSEIKWKMTCDCDKLECFVMKKSPVLSLKLLVFMGDDELLLLLPALLLAASSALPALVVLGVLDSLTLSERIWSSIFSSWSSICGRLDCQNWVLLQKVDATYLFKMKLRRHIGIFDDALVVLCLNGRR